MPGLRFRPRPSAPARRAPSGSDHCHLPWRNLYAPASQLAVTGNGTLAVAGTIVTDTVSVTGSAKLTNTAPVHTVPGVTYSYDAAHRLTQVKTPAATSAFGYDGNGRRASTTIASEHRCSSHSSAVPPLFSVAGNTHREGQANRLLDLFMAGLTAGLPGQARAKPARRATKRAH